MKGMRLFFGLLALAGCELQARPAGTQLAEGRDIDAPAIVWADQRPLFLFDRIVGDHTDLHAMSLGGDEAVWDHLSARTAWLSSSGFLVAEQDSRLSVFSLPFTAPLGSMAGVVKGLQGDDLLLRQGEGAATNFFLQRLPAGKLWELGSLAQRWFAPDGRLYYLQTNGIFRSLKATDSAPLTADRLASQFAVNPNQTHAVVRERPDRTANVPSETIDRLLTLPSLRELATLPLADRECGGCAAWLGFSPDGLTFYYAENHSPQASLVYQVDVEALGVNKVETRPGPSSTALLWNHSGDLGLLGERPCQSEASSCRVLYRSILRPGPSFAPLDSPVVGATFFPSDRFLLFEDALSGGRLMVARTELLSPEPTAQAVTLSPEGSLLDGSIIDGDTDTIVFFARPLGGKSSINLMQTAERSNLYAATAPDFTVRRLAEAADSVAVGRGYVLALVNFSPQDLTGDLVLFDLRSGHEQTLAAPVAAFGVTPDCPTAGSPSLDMRWQGSPTRSTEIGPGCPDRPSLLLTFIVRGRVKSSMDGLWSRTLPL